MDTDRLTRVTDRIALADTFGKRIRHERMEARLSQDALAERCQLERKTIEQIESGTRQPELVDFVALARGFGISPGSLLDDLCCAVDRERQADATPQDTKR